MPVSTLMKITLKTLIFKGIWLEIQLKLYTATKNFVSF